MNIDPIAGATIAILFALIFAAIQLAINYRKPPGPHTGGAAGRHPANPPFPPF